MTTDQSDLNAPSPERERLDFEKQEARRAADLEERRFRLERRSRWWTPVSIGVPLITFVITTIFTNVADHRKHIRDNREAALKEQRAFIERQLAEFYYPLLSASQADDIYWCLVIPDAIGCVQRQEPGKKKLTANERHDIDISLIVLNHKKTRELIESCTALVRNPEEPEVPNFQDQLRKYLLNTEVYDELRKQGDQQVPADFGIGYPPDFTKSIEQRIANLHMQEEELTRELNAL
jgi:hypothetical protein